MKGHRRALYYHPTTELRQNPEFQVLKSMVDKNLSGFRHDIEQDLHYFYADPAVVKRMTDTDKARSLVVQNDLANEMPWRVGYGVPEQETLISLPNLAYHIPPLDTDLEVLSGLRGYEIVDEFGDKVLKQAKKFSGSFLDQLVIIAAAEGSNEQRILDSGEAYSRVRDGMTIEFFVGGNFHGDYVMQKSILVESGPIFDPSGSARQFAPVHCESIHAYHSVEPGLVKALLLHASGGDPATLEEVKSEVLQTIRQVYDGRGGGDFGDFGTNARFAYPEIFYNPGEGIREGDILSSPHLVTVLDKTIRLEIRSEKNGVTFRNIKGAQVYETITIESEDIVRFIATMAAGNGGRTSVQEIYGLVGEARLSPLTN